VAGPLPRPSLRAQWVSNSLPDWHNDWAWAPEHEAILGWTAGSQHVLVLRHCFTPGTQSLSAINQASCGQYLQRVHVHCTGDCHRACGEQQMSSPK
jgi:hypothetical protein